MKHVKFYKKRFLLPDKLVGEGVVEEGQYTSDCSYSIIFDRIAIKDEYNLRHCTLKNPQTIDRLLQINRDFDYIVIVRR